MIGKKSAVFSCRLKESKLTPGFRTPAAYLAVNSRLLVLPPTGTEVV